MGLHDDAHQQQTFSLSGILAIHPCELQTVMISLQEKLMQE
jgi:hypothetical protein